jgi:hypothetical protein
LATPSTWTGTHLALENPRGINRQITAGCSGEMSLSHWLRNPVS